MMSGAVVSRWSHGEWGHGSRVSMAKVRRACTSITSHMKVRVRVRARARARVRVRVSVPARPSGTI